MPDFGLEPEANDTQNTAKPKVDMELISSIKPRTPARTSRDLSESDKMAEQAGFTSREPNGEPYIRPKRSKRAPEQTYPLSMRPPVSVFNRFIAYAEKHNLSYPRALEKLLDDAGEK